ncbi:MAG TPA: GNAT family N-acetyltransferase [Flavitalea sp.]|nr:GNAT family N-acetyltransferase [Flavitalea sp.]
MDDLNIYRNDFCISTEKSKLDLTAIHHFLSTQSYWSPNIPFDTVARAAKNSLTFGIYSGKQQIGYARIISDYATVAYLGDVYVLPEFRGQGLSKWLMTTIMTHSELQGLRRWILLTGDAHGLYKQFGWTAIANPERWMERV